MAGSGLVQTINFRGNGDNAKEGMAVGYYKTVVRAGATVEVTKSYTKRVGVRVRGRKEKPTAEEMEKINRMNAERTLRLKINANFGADDLFITLTYRKSHGRCTSVTESLIPSTRSSTFRPQLPP